MRRLLIVIAALGAGFYATALWWRRNPRAGTRFVNEVVDPWLERRGIIDASRGELARLEHVGRKTGKVRLTLVHPEWVPDGVRIMAPVGVESEWVRNVLAAGHCRLQVGDRLLELDEPLLVEPSEIDDVPAPVRALYQWLGFRYLRLHRFGEAAGRLGVPEAATVPVETPEAEAVAPTS